MQNTDIISNKVSGNIMSFVVKVRLFLEELYFCVLNEFPYLLKISILNKYSDKNFLLVIQLIDQQKKYYPPMNKRQQAHVDLMVKLKILVKASHSLNKYHEDQLQQYIEEYVGLGSKYCGITHPEFIRLGFNLENSKYKTYLRLKKREIFFNLLKNSSTTWKSVNSAIDQILHKTQREFIAFDKSWLENEIHEKQQYLKTIPNIFKIPEKKYDMNNDSERKKIFANDLIVSPYSKQINIEKNIKMATIKTQTEIQVLKKLLQTIKKNDSDPILQKYLPYSSDSLDDTLRKLLSSNEELKSEIIIT